MRRYCRERRSLDLIESSHEFLYDVADAGIFVVGREALRRSFDKIGFEGMPLGMASTSFGVADDR